MTGKAGAGRKLRFQPTTPEEIEELLELFGANVRAARKAAGLTQVELSKRSGFDQAEISAIERGKANCTLRTVDRLAIVLGSTAADLLRR